MDDHVCRAGIQGSDNHKQTVPILAANPIYLNPYAKTFRWLDVLTSIFAAVTLYPSLALFQGGQSGALSTGNSGSALWAERR
ncbi:UbiA prenyltransferase family protein [Edwardsiella piscicida]|nr:cystathionine gamma-synthase [Edwardsiella piscicida]GBK56551.1 UbiA prenyltransferase family protein [Edwardsiella piscicida]